MKVKLVVASGAHAGKIIPVAGPKFLVGRDPSCQLRPASMSISKMHCAIHVREQSVVIADFGSTNGTLVNNEPISGEHELRDGDRLVIGPLEFTVSLAPASRTNATPVPADLKAVPPAAPGLKAAAGKAPTPAPRPSPLAAGPKPTPAPQPKSSVAKLPPSPTVPPPAPAAPKSQPIPRPSEDPDHIAAMLLGMEDEDVPGGSTAIGIPALTDDDINKMKTAAEDKKKKAIASDSSLAAGDILKKMRGR